MRFDLTTRNLGYARLMRDAGISNSYVTTIEEILDNSDYENCRVPDYDTIRRMDLRILNRLNERQKRVIRMSYGLDDTVYDVHQIAKEISKGGSFKGFVGC